MWSGRGPRIPSGASMEPTVRSAAASQLCAGLRSPRWSGAGRGEGEALGSEGSRSRGAGWLLENGPRELELLFRAIVYHPSVPILIADNDRNYRDASTGAGRLLGLPRDKIIGQKMDDFADPRLQIPGFRSFGGPFWGRASRKVTLRLAGPDGTLWDVEYSAKGNVLPVRHLLVLRDKTASRRVGHPCRGRQRSDPVMGAGLCAVLVGRERTNRRLVFGSSAHLRLQRR